MLLQQAGDRNILYPSHNVTTPETCYNQAILGYRNPWHGISHWDKEYAWRGLGEIVHRIMYVIIRP